MDGYTVHLCQYKRTNGPSREKRRIRTRCGFWSPGLQYYASEQVTGAGVAPGRIRGDRQREQIRTDPENNSDFSQFSRLIAARIRPGPEFLQLKKTNL